MKHISRLFFSSGLALLLLLGGSRSVRAQQSFFEPVSTAQGRLAATARSIPNARLYQLNESGLRNALANAPRQFEPGQTPVTITIPLPNGTVESFTLRQTQVLSPALTAANPTFRTYEGEGTVHKGYIIRMSLTSLGFEALIWGVENDAVYFAPVKTDSGSMLYQSYYARDARKVGAATGSGAILRCGTIESTSRPTLPGLKAGSKGLRTAAGTNQISDGAQVRTFRIAIATTGEWTRNAGRYTQTPTDLAQVRTNALAVIMTAINRVNGIYERELASRFMLVNPDVNGPNNIVYDNPATDPYDNTDSTSQLTVNQRTVDTRVGSTSYDIGHLFGTGGGGVASSPSLCTNGVKAQGYSARGTNTGDPFVVDYFAHELGHQFDMKHTYNVSDADGACTTRSPEEAYEVASGSTIMSYVGICNEGRNLQQYNDFGLPAFHISSLTKATAYLSSDATNGCGTVSGSNAIPTVSAAGSYVIPRLTPFTLTATGADSDAGDAANLSYSWEEYDLAQSTTITTGTPAVTATIGATGQRGFPINVYDIDDDGVQRPILRAYSPVKNPERTFPSLVFILNPQNNATPGENQPVLFYTGTHPTGFSGATCPTNSTCIVGERLPAIARTMNFRVSVRDLRGGIADAGVSVSVVNTSGAFRLTSFDSATTVAGNSQQLVTWNVVGTNTAPINCASVAIRYSSDGGLTFPTTLLASTPNDGSETITLPNVSTSSARIRVEAVGNIFFDISNANFTITPAQATAPVATANASQTATVGTAFAYTVNAFTGTAPITYSATGLPAGLSFDVSSRVISGTATTPATTTVTITGTNSAGMSSTSFNITVNPAPTQVTAPVATTNASQTATVGTAFAYTVNAFTGTAPITYMASNLPAGLSFDASSRVISGTATTPATTTVTITGTNSAGMSSTSFNITVNPAPTQVTAPVATTNANQTATVGTAFAYTVNAFTGTAPITYTASNLPAGLSFDASSRVISGTATTPATTTVTITGTNSAGMSSTSFNITVNPAPTPTGPATLTVTSFTCNIGTNGSGSVNFVVTRSDATTTPTVPDLFINGVTITGKLGTPYTFAFDANVQNLPVQDQASRTTYFVWNFRQACAQPVQVMAPVATTNASQTATVGTAFAYTVNAFTGTAPITYSATGLPAGLSFDANSRVISGTATTPATTTVTITGTNSAGMSSTSFNITVNPAPTPTGPATLTVTSFTCNIGTNGSGSVNFVVTRSDATTTPTVPDLFINGVTITGKLGTPYTFAFDANVQNLPVQDQASRATYFVWNFRQACANRISRIGAEPVSNWQVKVLGNPSVSDWADLEIQDAQGLMLQVLVADVQGRTISEQRVLVTEQTLRLRTRLGGSAGLYLMQVSDGNHRQTLRVVHP